MTNANKKALHAKMLAIINELPIADFVALHNSFCNSEEYGGNPNTYIYEMNRFNEMHENMTPEEIVRCTCNSDFDVTDGYWFETDEGGEYSASTREDLIKKGAWLELNTVYADFIIEWCKEKKIEHLTDNKDIIECMNKQKPDFTDWKKVEAKVNACLSNGIDELFTDFQTNLKIENGKIHPCDSIELDEKLNELADLIVRVLKYEKGEA